MNTRKSKRRRKEAKSVFKSKTKDGKAEVFVLSPDLLHKLGINLANVAFAPDFPTNITSQIDSSFLNGAPNSASGPARPSMSNGMSKNDVAQVTPKTSENVKEENTTILETANLMKESVFLSPTFATPSNNVDLDEIELTNSIDPEINKNETSSAVDGINDLSSTATELLTLLQKSIPERMRLNQEKSIENHTELVNSRHNKNLEADLERFFPDSNFISLSSQDSEQKAMASICKKLTVSTDDHPDEAYLSDCSNSNSTSIDNTDVSQDNSKVKILSEEILGPSKLRELKNMFSPNKSDLVSVSVNTVLTSNQNVPNDTVISNVRTEINKQYSDAYIPGFHSIVTNADSHVNIMHVENVVLNNETGNVLPTASDTNAENIGIICDGRIEAWHLNSENIVIQNDTKNGVQTPENTLGDVDLAVIGMEIEENIDILHNFVTEITSNENNKLFDKIEKTEKECEIKYQARDINAEAQFGLKYSPYLKLVGKDTAITSTNHVPSAPADLDSITSITSKCLPSIIEEAEAKKVSLVAQTIINSNVILPNDDLGNNITQRTGLDDKNAFESITHKIGAFDSNVEDRAKNNIQEPVKKFKDLGSPNKLLNAVETKDVVDLSHENSTIHKREDEKLKDEFINNNPNYNNLDEESFQDNDVEICKVYGMIQGDNIKSETHLNCDREYAELIEKSNENAKNYNRKSECIDFINTKDSFSLKRNNSYESNINIYMNIKDSVNIMQEKYDVRLNQCKIEVNSNKSKTEILKSVTDIHIDKLESKSKELRKKSVTVNRDGNIPIDKVQEIAMYLSQIKKSRTSKSESSRKTPETPEIPAKRSKRNALSSKMCIQGVEKPGGSGNSNENHKTNKVLKTYGRASKTENKSITLPVTFISNLQEKSHVLDLQEDQTIINKEHIKGAEFCLCYDFGSLTFYENDNDCVYEHIHFWEHKIVDCHYLDLFSIFKEDNLSDNTNLIGDHDQDIDPNSDVQSICWHSYIRDNVVKQQSDTSSMIELNSITTRLETCSSVETAVIHHNQNDSRGTLQFDASASTSVPVSQKSAPVNEKTVVEVNTTETNGANNTKKEIIITGNDIKSAKVNHKESETRQANTDTSNFSQENHCCTKSYKKMPKETDSASGEMESCQGNFSANDTDVSAIDNGNNADEHQVETNFQIEPEEGTYNKNVHKKGKKRRHAKNSVCENLDNNEPENKKAVKCGVCEETLSDALWDDHINEKHCLIAWRSGTSFNFEDPGLLKKLQEKIKNTSNLKCTFCQSELVKPKSFIKHVQKCFKKARDSLDSTLDTSRNHSMADIKIEDQPDVENKHSVISETIDQVVEGHAEPCGKMNDDTITCGVCKETVAATDWIEHITRIHEYIAWKEGETPLNSENEEDVRLHLKEIAKIVGHLICSKCGLTRKYPKSYLLHIQNCSGNEDTSNIQKDNDSQLDEGPKNNDSQLDEGPKKNRLNEDSNEIKCGVCNTILKNTEWIQHIKEKHMYLAWKEGEEAMDLNDECKVRVYLYNLSKRIGGLVCNKCGCSRKYVKSYLSHIESCSGLETNANPVKNEQLTPRAEKVSLSSDDDDKELSKLMVKCGVCQKKIFRDKWIDHIGRAHHYLAWKDGETLNVNDQVEVNNHLSGIAKKVGHLVCSNCGILRKKANAFLDHIDTCDKAVPTTESCDENDQNTSTSDKLVCAVCSKEVDAKNWYKHKMDAHYNVAWTVGSVPIDIDNSSIIDCLLKEYMAKYKKMVCKLCGTKRVSHLGFYAHVIACGKTEEELDIRKNLCNICNKKYLRIYHNQHMQWHSQQEIIKVKKEESQNQMQMKMTMQSEVEALTEEDGTPKRRRAAQKANLIIDKFKTEQYAFKCPNCKYSADTKEELAIHECKSKDDEGFSDSEQSVKFEDNSEEESDDITDDEDVSGEEEREEMERRPKKKKKPPAYALIPRFPFEPKKLQEFLVKAGTEFYQQHYTNDSVFPDLRPLACEPVPDVQLSDYLPPLEESCKFQFFDKTWRTHKRFEAEMKKCPKRKDVVAVPCQSFFAGAYVQSIAWAPAGPDEDNSGGNFLAVATHRGADIARHTADQTSEHHGLIQLWAFGEFNEVCEFVLGIAHDYGTAWAMDWCPSGARAVYPADPAASDVLRLGLLAVAFSSGRTCVFSVPYPSMLERREDVICRLKPVVELRMSSNPDRKEYQATSVCWSPQKPYESIVVGYSDGTVAYFDLNTESPFLKTIQNGLTILYPYYDERAHTTCVTGVGLYPSLRGASPSGATCSSSLSGAALAARGGARPARQLAHSAIGSCVFQPLWPSVVLMGDDANIATAVNELEWHGGGRRFNGCSAGAGCQRCGASVLAALPLLRLRRPHPADYVANKKTLGVLQMVPLSKKRLKLKNDELQTIVEPTTYEDAIRKYGIELKTDKEAINKTLNKAREYYPVRHPDRYPLSEVPAMAFCPAAAHHRLLAVATHAGLLFILNV